MKTLPITTAILMATAGSLSAVTYYSTDADTNPTSGSTWNTQADGLGTNGFSTTYTNAASDIIIQSGDTVDAPRTVVDLTWAANSYTLNGTLRAGLNAGTSTQTFNTDIAVAASGAAITIGHGDVTLTGTGNLQLGTGTMVLQHSSSTSAGSMDFGLNIVGSGIIDFGHLDADLGGITFSNLSSDFTGILGANNGNDTQLNFAAGDGALGATLRIGRNDDTKLIKLNLDGNFSFNSLVIDGDTIAAGVYTVTDLVALNATYANNLIDNGGTVYVGQAIPEPSTYAMIGGLLALGYVMVRRRA